MTAWYYKWERAPWGTRWGYVNLDTEQADALVEEIDLGFIAKCPIDNKIIGIYSSLEAAKKASERYVKNIGG